MKNKLRIIATAVTLLSFPNVNFAQAPNLGATSGFALFTKVGAFGNSGPTNVTGDIGTNSGSFTGFPPGIVTGQIHVGDSVSAQAAVDVDTAYNELGATACDTAIGTTLGNGQTLTRKVYCLSALSTLNGNLILDGQGDSNALFIFKINGAFSTGTHTNILLVNSASLKNVYWRINGAFTLGDSSVFRGTIIANGAITLLSGSNIFGRGLSIGGAIALNHNISSLPVKLLSFSAGCDDQNVVLKWSTVTEINNNYYSIERGTDGINWEVIGKVNGAGNSSTLTNYSFIDKEPYIGVSYYRLRQTDFDGRFNYFNILAVKNSGEDLTELNIYPNPSNGTINLLFRGEQNKVNSVSINDILGKTVYHSPGYQSAIDLSNLQGGIYFLHFSSDSKMITQKLVIEKH